MTVTVDDLSELLAPMATQHYADSIGGQLAQAKLKSERDGRTMQVQAERIAGLRNSYAEVLELKRDAERALREFKIRTVARMLKAKDDENWCDDGFEQAMGDLDLPTPQPEYRATVTIDVTVTGAGSEYTAKDWIINALSSSDGDVMHGDLDFEVEEIGATYADHRQYIEVFTRMLDEE